MEALVLVWLEGALAAVRIAGMQGCSRLITLTGTGERALTLTPLGDSVAPEELPRLPKETRITDQFLHSCNRSSRQALNSASSLDIKAFGYPGERALVPVYILAYMNRLNPISARSPLPFMHLTDHTYHEGATRTVNPATHAGHHIHHQTKGVQAPQTFHANRYTLASSVTECPNSSLATK